MDSRVSITSLRLIHVEECRYTLCNIHIEDRFCKYDVQLVCVFLLISTAVYTYIKRVSRGSLINNMWRIIIFIINCILSVVDSILLTSYIHQKYHHRNNSSRKRNSSSLYIRKIDTDNNNKSSSAQRQKRRPPRQQRRVKTGLSNICPPLGGIVGAPELPVLTTKDPRIIERWIDEHVGTSNEYTILGFDSESIAKPPWKPERQSLPDGPATVQLSTTTSCIIIQLALCGNGSASYAPKILQNVINDPKIIKVGVGVDDDALELYRWSLEEGNEKLIYDMKSRLDLGCLLPDTKSNRRAGREYK